jgi:sec-independent protein translocase protein TatA
MGSMSIWHWVLVLVVVALLFGGRGKLSGLMGDAAKGIKAFKEGLKDDEKPETPVTGSLPADKARDEVKN